MNESAKQSTPIWFWIVGGILLLWNLMGLAVFVTYVLMVGNKEMMDSAALTEVQQELVNNTPTWVLVAFGIAVICGVLGCIALLMRKKIAIPILILSLLGVIAQNVYVYFLSNSIEVMGVGLTPVVIPIAIAMVPFAIFCGKQAWFGPSSPRVAGA